MKSWGSRDLRQTSTRKVCFECFVNSKLDKELSNDDDTTSEETRRLLTLRIVKWNKNLPKSTKYHFVKCWNENSHLFGVSVGHEPTICKNLNGNERGQGKKRRSGEPWRYKLKNMMMSIARKITWEFLLIFLLLSVRVFATKRRPHACPCCMKLCS